MKSLSLVFVLVVVAPASADNENLWPVLHDVLGAQREKPCKEVWTHSSDVTTYTMKLDAGRVLERVNSRGSDLKRYAYDAQNRIVSIEGDDNLLGDFTVKLRYGKRGLEKVTEVQAPVEGSRRKKPSTFELIWRFPQRDTVRISVAIDGDEKATDVLRYKTGKLTSMELSVGDVMTAGYDDKGRLATMTTTHDGKTTAVKTYSYDASGRLVREELDRDVDGKVDQKHEYSYTCDAK